MRGGHLGRRYESKKNEVRDAREEGDRIKTDRETLKNEYSLLSAVDDLLSDLDDEAVGAIAEVENVGEQENVRLESEKQENDDEKEQIADEIDDELQKLRSGIESLNEMDSNPFGKKSVEQAKKVYKEQLMAYKNLLKELDEDSGDSAGDFGASGFVSAESGSFNEFGEAVTESIDNAFLNSGQAAFSNKDGYRSYLVTNGLVGNADFGNLDSKTVADITAAIEETKTMFPELDLKFVGSLQSRNEYIENGLTNMYLEIYRQYNPDVPDEKLQAAVRAQVAEEIKEFIPSQGTIAQSLFVENAQDFSDSIIAGMNGITINETYGSDYNYFKSVRKSDVDAGWKPQNCYSPKATVDHELGHQIAKLVDAHNDDTIQYMFEQFSGLGEGEKAGVLSGYAGTNIHEFIAESWSEYKNNPQCRDCARTVAERMIELHESTQPRLIKVLRRR